jgi:hypothetical protein
MNNLSKRLDRTLRRRLGVRKGRPVFGDVAGCSRGGRRNVRNHTELIWRCKMQEWLESEDEDRPEEPEDMPYEDPLDELYPGNMGTSRGGMSESTSDIEAIPPSTREALPSSAEVPP